MKNTAKWLIQSLLTAMGALGTVLCFTSAFSVSVNVPVLTLLSLISALLFMFCFTHKKALWVLIPALLTGKCCPAGTVWLLSAQSIQAVPLM